MALLILSYLAGVLTIAAPCVLPLLPIIIGGSLLESSKDRPDRQWLRPLVITASLALSVVVFTLLIKATTVLLGVPQLVWQTMSGIIVLLMGINYLWPRGWEIVSQKLHFARSSNAGLGKATKRKGLTGAVLIGLALGPVFTSCSPTYALIVATILPASFSQGLTYLAAYALGMSTALLLVSYVGQIFTARLRWLSNPNSWFKRLIGALFIIVGIVVIIGFDKTIQTYVLDQGWYDPISNLEQRLRR